MCIYTIYVYILLILPTLLPTGVHICVYVCMYSISREIAVFRAGRVPMYYNAFIYLCIHTYIKYITYIYTYIECTT